MSSVFLHRRYWLCQHMSSKVRTYICTYTLFSKIFFPLFGCQQDKAESISKTIVVHTVWVSSFYYFQRYLPVWGVFFVKVYKAESVSIITICCLERGGSIGAVMESLVGDGGLVVVCMAPMVSFALACCRDKVRWLERWLDHYHPHSPIKRW